MTIDPSTLRDEALRLPAPARARLAADLLRSLDDVDDEDLDPAAHDAEWGAEIAARLRDVDEGKIQPVPWAEARGRMAGED